MLPLKTQARPIAPNSNPDGSDNEEGREQNRRTELVVIGTVGNLFEDMDDLDED